MVSQTAEIWVAAGKTQKISLNSENARFMFESTKNTREWVWDRRTRWQCLRSLVVERRDGRIQPKSDQTSWNITNNSEAMARRDDYSEVMFTRKQYDHFLFWFLALASRQYSSLANSHHLPCRSHQQTFMERPIVYDILNNLALFDNTLQFLHQQRSHPH